MIKLFQERINRQLAKLHICLQLSYVNLDQITVSDKLIHIDFKYIKTIRQ